jgi:hypothetical protein
LHHDRPSREPGATGGAVAAMAAIIAAIGACRTEVTALAIQG